MPASKSAKYPPKPPDLTDGSIHIVTALEAGALLRVGKNPLYAAIASGDIPSVRVGARIKVPAAWLREQLHIEVVEPSPVVESSEPEPNDPSLRELAREQIPRAVMKPSRKRAVPAGAR